VLRRGGFEMTFDMEVALTFRRKLCRCGVSAGTTGFREGKEILVD
jgi:hypothetical protein